MGRRRRERRFNEMHARQLQLSALNAQLEAKLGQPRQPWGDAILRVETLIRYLCGDERTPERMAFEVAYQETLRRAIEVALEVEAELHQ